MNATQLKAMRTMWEDVSRPEETMTAREMALTSHDLSRDGYRASTADGRVWTWDDRRNLWAI
jgi:hypothetical protein